MIDTDTVKEIKAEERAYEQWERNEKNRILSMANEERKQREWQRLFTPMQEPDDSYLEGGVY